MKKKLLNKFVYVTPDAGHHIDKRKDLNLIIDELADMCNDNDDLLILNITKP
jgi:hypothetical protein